MLEALHKKKRVQLIIGFGIGIVFGFLLDKGGVTEYSLILNQLLLKDFRVFKIIATAVITGMIGLYVLVTLDYAELHPKPCRVRAILSGGLIFGAGFALLGYCPGTAAGAMGTGSLHAMIGVVGIMIGAGVFASVYPRIRETFIHENEMGPVTIPELLHLNPWIVMLLLSLLFLLLMYLTESVGL